MGLFDLFKKKDAAFYLNRGRKALEGHRWVAARDDFKEGLSLRDVPVELQASLQEALTEANRGICRLNLDEVERSHAAGEYSRALECLDTARLHAPDDEARARIEALTTAVREAKAEAAKKPDVLQPVALQDLRDEQGPVVNPEFEAYLAGLAPDVAELYASFSEVFADAYVAMNAGDPQPMLELLPRMRASSEEAQALLAFEHGRAFLMAQQPEQALLLLDIAASIRGSMPIFLADHPSIAYLRFEALAMLDRLEEGVTALEEGLQARPEHPELQVTLASALIALKRLDEAEPLLTKTLSCSKGDPQVHVLRSRLLMERGDPSAAAEALEAGIKSCACGPSALPHPLLARSLVDLYLSRHERPDRVERLLNQLFMAQNGEGEWIDHFLRARFLKWQGDMDLARASLRQAIEGLDDPADPRRAQLEEFLNA